MIIGNQEEWAKKGTLKALGSFMGFPKSLVINIPIEPISEGWLSTLENLVMRLEKINKYVEKENNSVGVVSQVGLVFMPGIPRPVIAVLSGICFGSEKVVIGYSIGPPLLVLGKEESFTIQLASIISKKPFDEDPLEEFILDYTKGHQSLTDLTEQAVKNALIAYKLGGNQPFIFLKNLKEYFESELGIDVSAKI